MLIGLLDRPARARVFLGLLLLAFLASAALPVLTLVQFRMLPDANETTFLVSIDAPPSSPVARTTEIADAVGAELAKIPEIADYETFVGTNAIPDLAALLQGTVFRNAPNLADIRVNLVPKDKRKIQSAAFVQAVRPRLAAIAERYGATLRILQTPPGPPVRDTILAKIYGPDPDVRRAIASRVSDMLQRERGVVDVDSSFKALPASLQLEVDQRKASLSGVSAADIAQTLGMALHGATVSTLHAATEPRPSASSCASRPNTARTRRRSHRSKCRRAWAGWSRSPRSRRRRGATRAAALSRRLRGRLVRRRRHGGPQLDVRRHRHALRTGAQPLPQGYRIDWDGEWHLTNTVFADLGRRC